MMSLIIYIGVLMDSIFVSNAGEYHRIGEIVLIDGQLMCIDMIIEDEVFLRYLSSPEWVSYQFRKLLYKLGL